MRINNQYQQGLYVTNITCFFTNNMAIYLQDTHIYSLLLGVAVHCHCNEANTERDHLMSGLRNSYISNYSDSIINEINDDNKIIKELDFLANVKLFFLLNTERFPSIISILHHNYYYSRVQNFVHRMISLLSWGASYHLLCARLYLWGAFTLKNSS